MSVSSPTDIAMRIRGRSLHRDRALIMAIVNRTPDSFYDHGATWEIDAARAAIVRAVGAGADVIDIGGVPASPGTPVSVEEEIDRVVPSLQWAREQYPEIVLSIDTYRGEAAHAACAAGADLINDSWGGWDPELLTVAAEYGAGYVCAHTGGLEPRTDPTQPRYADVVASVIEETTGLAERALAAGVPREGILIDPAIDFTKNTHHSLAVLREMSKLVDTGWPVLLAMSNKTVVSETLDVPLEGRLTGTLAATALAAQAGVTMVRAHQVEETRQTLEMVASVTGRRPPARAIRWLA